MLRSTLCFALLLALAPAASAVVIRDDVDDLQYRLAAASFPALVDIPGEGHGVLIAPQWVLTAAHAVTWQTELRIVTVGGTPRAVERVVLHPGYRKLPQPMIDAAIASGDGAAVTAHVAASDDVALLRLAQPVDDVAPVKIHRAPAVGEVVRIIGKGATGTGAHGHSPHGPNRTDLRQAFNAVSSIEGRWLGYVFDAPPGALPLEGAAGNGDSGGPLLVAAGDDWQLAGITSWKRVDGHIATACPGRYGQWSYAVNVAHYAGWIEATMADAGVAGR